METLKSTKEGKIHKIQPGDVYSSDGIKREVVLRYEDIVLGAQRGRYGWHNAEILEIQKMKSDRVWPTGTVTLAGSESLPKATFFGEKGFAILDFDLAKAIFISMAKDTDARNFRQKYQVAKNLAKRCLLNEKH